MKIIKKGNSINAVKPEGIKVWYYLFPEYEIHYNEQEPHTKQVWHHHETIWESIYIIEGELLVKWKENGEEKQQLVEIGDLIETEHSPHAFVNNSDHTVKFLVIKQILSGKDKRGLLKADKVLD